MKKITVFYFLLFALFVLSKDSISQPTVIPSSDEILLPKFMCSGAVISKRVPFACMLKLTGLTANATYRYITGATTNANVTSGSSPGNFYAINNVAGAYGNITGYTSQKSLAGLLLNNDSFITNTGNNRYAEFTTDANGDYKGYFSLVTTGNNVFKADSNVYFYVSVNDGAGGTTVDKRFRTTNTIKMLAFGSNNTSGSTDCSAIRGNSLAPGETFVFLYDNVSNSNRPLYGTWAENDGITTNFSSWYSPTVDTTSGAWGAIIPNDNANGVRRIESRDWSGNVLYFHTNANGVWPNGTNTVNPVKDTIPLVIALNDAPLGSTGPVIPKIKFSNTTSSIGEGAGTTSVTINISSAPTNGETVDIIIKGGSATNSTDFSLATAVANFTSGSSSSQSITVNISDDQLTEGAEDIVLVLRNASSGLAIDADSVTTITINDNDVPNIAFSTTSQTVNEDADTVWFDVTLSNPDPANSTKIDVALTGGSSSNGSDFSTFTTQTLTFTANSTTPQKFWIKITDDLLDENNEDLIFSLQNPTNNAQITGGTLNVTIRDNDTTIKVTFPGITFDLASDSVIEGASASVKVSITAADTSKDITVDLATNGGTAINGTHYSFTNKTLTFLKSTTTLTQTISLNTISDNKISGSHKLFLKLQNASNNASIGSPDTYELTIKEDGKNSINPVFKELGVEMYPNPTTDILYLNSKEVIENITITDISGKLVYQNLTNQKQNTINTSNFAKGFYIVHIYISNQETVQKICIY